MASGPRVFTCGRTARAGCPELFNNKVKNDVIDGYYKKALDSHNVGEAVYRIAIDPKPKLRQCARLFLSWCAWLHGWVHYIESCIPGAGYSC